MQIKVSVIIPVYNAEKYIAECILSLLKQTLSECEFIFVNDGSTDYSGAVIENFKLMDSRITLINQENQGVSIARNNGLKAAIGDYIGFVDADDYVELDFFEKLYRSARIEDCDIVISNFESEIEGHKVITKYPFPIGRKLEKDFINSNMLPYFIEKDDLNTACNKIYKRKILIDNNIQFPEKVALGEDGMFNLYCFSFSSLVKYIDYTGYHYKEVIGSATRNIINQDYFSRALELYTSKLPEVMNVTFDNDNLQKLKSIKFINSVMSYIHIYFSSQNELSIKKKYHYVKNMISNHNVQNALPVYLGERACTLGLYEKLLLGLIRCRSTLGLFLLTAYSRYRNNFGGK